MQIGVLFDMFGVLDVVVSFVSCNVMVLGCVVCASCLSSSCTNTTPVVLICVYCWLVLSVLFVLLLLVCTRVACDDTPSDAHL